MDEAKKKEISDLNELKENLSLEIRDRQNQIDDVWVSLSQAWDAIQNHRECIEKLTKKVEAIEEDASAPIWRKVVDCFFQKGLNGVKRYRPSGGNSQAISPPYFNISERVNA